MAGISHGTTDQAAIYGLFNKDNLHEVHEGTQYQFFF